MMNILTLVVNDMDMQQLNSTTKKHLYDRDEKHKRTRRLKEGKEVLSCDICFFDYCDECKPTVITFDQKTIRNLEEK